MRRISGRMLYLLAKEPFMVWCALFAPFSEREEFSSFTQQLMQKGREFEQEYEKSLGAGEHVDIDLNDFDKGYKQTRALMKEGADIIYNAPLVDKGNGLQGIPDVLVKKTMHKSVFGRYHYIVQEVKMSKEVKKEHVLQAGFYHLLVGRAQGYMPRYFFVVTKGNGRPEVHKFDWHKHEQGVKRAIQRISDIREGKEAPLPNVKQCEEPWLNYCRKRAVKLDDISLVANASTPRQQLLRNAGINTVAKLSRATNVPGIPSSRMAQLRASAKAYKTGKFMVLQKPSLPCSDTELFIDFEGAEFNGKKTEYLLGIIKRDTNGVSFHPFIAYAPDEEGRMFKEAVAFINTHEHARIFHYAAYEKTAMKLLGGKYDVDVKNIIKHMTDLLQACRRCIAPPTSTYRLKDIAKALGAEWRETESAGDSMVLYEDYQKTKDDKLLQQIIDYNEDDCRATLIVKDWLAKQ